MLGQAVRNEVIATHSLPRSYIEKLSVMKMRMRRRIGKKKEVGKERLTLWLGNSYCNLKDVLVNTLVG